MLIEAFEYKIWADDRTLRAVESIDKDKFPENYSFTLQQINHMVIVEELFKSRIKVTDPPHENTNTSVVPDFYNLKDRLVKSGRWYLKYVSSLTEHKKVISFEFADGKNGNMSIEEILFHIVNHGTYHRGNIAHTLDLASVPHPPDGYGIFIHEKEPERRN